MSVEMIQRLDEAGEYADKHGFTIKMVVNHFAVYKVVKNHQGEKVGFQKAVSYLAFCQSHLNILVVRMMEIDKAIQDLGHGTADISTD